MKTKATWLFCIVLLSSLSLAQSLPVVNPAQQLTSRFADQYGKLRMSFEANQGQTDPQVKFLSRGNGYSLFLTPTEAVLALKGNESTSPVRMRLIGADRDPKVAGLNELPGKSNYFSGKDSTKWRTNIAQYAKIRYQAVYPGIDLIYYGSQRQLEHDFIIAPGANPNRISIATDGEAKLNINENGDLILRTSGGQVRLEKPVAYQEVNGLRRSVAARFRRMRHGRIGFAIGNYDRQKQLIIDPVLVYSTYLGGTGLDVAQGIAVDSSGNAYITGHTTSLDFPTVSPLQPANNGGLDIFVAKINAAGSALVYATYLGGSASTFEDAGGIAVDAAGNAYLTGSTDSADFPTTLGAFQTTIGSRAGITSIDAYVTKLNAAGNAVVYSTFLGGAGEDHGLGIAVDSSGNAYITGETTSTDFPTANPFQGTFGGVSDAFVTKVNASGTGLLYSTYLGGNAGESGLGIALDISGNAYVAGNTTSLNFPTAHALQPACALNVLNGFCSDAFIAKLSADGAALTYSTYLGGGTPGTGNGASESAKGIAVDATGSAYVIGETDSLDFPTVSPFQANCAQNSFGNCADIFVAKLNSAGSALVYSTYLGGTAGENAAFGAGIAVDASGNAYVTGSTGSVDFPTKSPVQLQSGGGADAFVAALNPAGTALIFSTYIGGSGTDDSRALALDGAGSVYITGTTDSTDFPLANALQPVNAGAGGDVFVTKISPVTSALTAACTVNGSTAPVTVLVTSYVAYNANPNPASASTCDWNPGTPLPGAFDTAAGSSCAPSSPIYTAIAGGTFSESVTVTNGSNVVTSSCPALTVQDFSLSVTPPSATALPGGVVNYTVAASSINGFTGQINFVQSTTLPSGVSAAWSPTNQSCTVPAGGSCSATYTVTVGAGASAGDTGLVFHGTYAPVLTTRSASAALHVPPAPIITSISPLSGNRGQSLSVTVTGANFQTGATLMFHGISGSRITVSAPSVSLGGTTLTATITIPPDEPIELKDVSIVNPASQPLTKAFRVDAEFLIFSGALNEAADEPSLAVDPRDPNHSHLVVGFNVLTKDKKGNWTFNHGKCGWAESFDGGHSWNPGSVQLPAPFEPTGDPWVRYSRSGQLFYSCMGSTGSGSGSAIGIFMWISQSGPANNLTPSGIAANLNTRPPRNVRVIRCKSEPCTVTDEPTFDILENSSKPRLVACWLESQPSKDPAVKIFSNLNTAFSDGGTIWSNPTVLFPDPANPSEAGQKDGTQTAKKPDSIGLFGHTTTQNP